MMEKQKLELLRNVPIHKVLGVSNDGRRQTFRCPIHNEKSGSFVVYPDGGYHCYGCGANGRNALDFLVDLSGSFREAVVELEKYI